MIRKYYFLVLYFLKLPLNLIKKNKIHYTSRISNNTKISRSIIGKYCYLACNIVLNNTRIGNYCSIAAGVQIGGMEHSYWWWSTSTFLSDKCISSNKTIIGNDVWIGAGAIIKQGIKIGDGAVIGAMSFVNKDVSENSIVFGNPAKQYKNRMDSQLFDKLKQTNYWNLSPGKAKEILFKLDNEYTIHSPIF